VSGLISGGGGNDTLTITADESVVVELGNAFSDNLNVHEVESVVGNANRSTALYVAGGDNEWIVSGDNVGTVAGVSFSSFANLRGGSGTDTFTILDGGSFTGGIDGGGETDGYDRLIIDSSEEYIVDLGDSDDDSRLYVSNLEIIEGND